MQKYSVKSWSAPTTAWQCEHSPLGYCRYIAGVKLGESRCWLCYISCLDGLNCFPTKCRSKGKERLPAVLLWGLRVIRGEKSTCSEKGVTSPEKKNFLAQRYAHNTHQFPRLRAWPSYIYVRQRTDLPVTILHSKQPRVWPAHAGPLPSMPRISGGGRTCASNGSPGTYQIMHSVANQQIKKKVWGSLPGHRVQPGQNWFRNNNVFQEGFKTSAWGLTTKYQETSKEEVIHIYPARFCMAEGFQGIPSA